MTISFGKYIETNPKICHGKPVFTGTRVMVWQVLELLKEGASEEEIHKAYPSIKKGSVKAALEYATIKVKDVSYIPFENAKTSRIPA